MPALHPGASPGRRSGTLLTELETDVRQRGMTIDRDLLKTVLAQMIRSHRIVRGSDLEQAMERVA